MKSHPCCTFRARRFHRRGFSLVECGFSILLVAVVLIGALRAVAGAQRARAEAQTQRRSIELAERIVSEIRQAWYLDPNQTPGWGTESGEFNFFNRVNYDDVDDYTNITEMLIKDKDGSNVAGSSGYSRFRDIDWVDPANPQNTVASDMGLKRITVQVTAPDGRVTRLYALRSSKGIGEQTVNSATTFVTWVGASIAVGSNPTISSGTFPINAPQ